MEFMKIAVFWGGKHTLPGVCDENTWYSFYNSGWKYGFESLGHDVKYFSWDDVEDRAGYDLYIYAPGFLTNLTYHPKIYHPNIFFTEEASCAVSWAASHSYYYDAVAFLDYINWKAVKHIGVKNAYWVPGAVDPVVFRNLNQERIYNTAFLGSYDDNVKIIDGKTRLDFIRAIDAHNKPSMVARGYYAFEANKIWNVTKIGVDVPIVEFCSFRLFQIIASGAFCVTRKTRLDSGISQLLQTDMYDTYENINDLVFNVSPYWISKNQKRDDLSKKAQDFVLKNHTFKNRAEQMLKIAGLIEGAIPYQEG